MDEMTVEEACEILTEAEWRGLVWKPDTLSGCKYIGADSENAGNLNTFTLTVDAIAIVTGILDRKRVSELEHVIDVAERLDSGESISEPQPHPRIWSIIAGNRQQLAQVTQERDALQKKVSRLQDMKLKEFADSQAYRFLTELTSLRKAVEPVLVALRQVPEDQPTFIDYIKSDGIEVGVGEITPMQRCALLAAYEQKDGNNG